VLQPGEARFGFQPTGFAGAWSRSTATPGLEIMVRIQRLGLLDLISKTEWTSPVTRDPSSRSSSGIDAGRNDSAEPLLRQSSLRFAYSSSGGMRTCSGQR
jgi:hypothetical protein